MILDYVRWYYKKTGDKKFKPDTYLTLTEPELTYFKGKIWKQILELCYTEHGIYWFCKFILGNLMYAGYPEPIIFTKLWKKWMKICKKSDHIAIIAPRQHGKTVIKDTKVVCESGIKPISDINVGEKVICLDEGSLQQKLLPVTDKTEEYKKVLYEVITNTGRICKISSEHPLFSIDGWKTIESGLSVDDYIGIPRNFNINGKNSNINIAKLLGFIVSKGCCYEKGCSITNQDFKILTELKQCYSNLGHKSNIKKTKKTQSDINYVLTLDNIYKYASDIRNQNSYNKIVPKYIFGGNKSVITTFLSYLFEGDGHLNKDYSVEYLSMSKQLVLDVQYLLQMFDIQSLIREKKVKNSKNEYYYRLIINDINVIKFQRIIGFVSERKLASHCSILINKKRNEKLDIIPKQLIKKYYNGYIRNNWSREQLKTRIEQIKKGLYNTDIEQLNLLTNSNIFWDKIVSIKCIGEQDCYDIQVGNGKNNYIASGIYSHNSSFWTVIQSIYRVSLFENYNVLIESATEDQAIMLLGFITNIIEKNEFLSSKISKSAKWSTTEISYNGGKIVGKGIGSEVRGGTYDLILCDDVLRSDNKLSDDDIEKFIDEELEPMILVRKGQLIIVGTRKSYTDVYSTIEERINEECGWILYKFSAILNFETKEILCPERFTWEELMRKQSVMGKAKFAKEFLGDCYSSGTQIFPNNIRKRAMELGKNWVMFPTARICDSDRWIYSIGVDTARAGTASADYTVVTVLAYDPKTQMKRICWIWRAKGIKTAEQVEKIAEITKKFNYPVILVEQNNLGQDFIDMLVDGYNLHVESFQTGARGQAKEDLIRFLVNTLEHEKMIFPTGDETSREMIEVLDKELSKFVVEITKAGNEVMKGSGRSKDDSVISLALANKCSQYYGYQPFAISKEKSKHETELGRFAQTNEIMEIMKL